MLMDMRGRGESSVMDVKARKGSKSKEGINGNEMVVQGYLWSIPDHGLGNDQWMTE